MKRRPLLLLTFALGCGVLSAYLARGLMQGQAAAPASPASQITRIAVAARDLPGGAVVGPGDVKMVEWPAASVPSGFVASPEGVVGQGLRTPIAANEPLLEPRLAGRGVAGLPSVIPPGKRAVSVRVDDVIAVAGFVVPGTRVDVLVTLPSEADRPGLTRAVLQNVQVLAAGQSIQPTSNGQPQEATVITLLVSPEEAEVLTLASNEGRIQLALRNTLDESLTTTAGARLGRLSESGTVSPAPPQEPTRRRSAPTRYSGREIEVYNGSTRTVATF